MSDNDGLIILDAAFTDNEVWEEYTKHILAGGYSDFGRLLTVNFVVLESSYAEFRAELEAREGITDVCAMGERGGVPSGEITQEMRDVSRRILSAGNDGPQVSEEFLL